MEYVNFWGHSDADMLEIGNGWMTLTQERSHFALWAAMKSPLLIGCDLAQISKHSLDVLKNDWLLKFNQDDIIGEPARPYKWGTNPNWTFNNTHPAEYWSGNSKHGIYVLVFNNADKQNTKNVAFSEVPELDARKEYRIINAWSNKDLGCFARGVDLKLEAHDTGVLVFRDDCGGGKVGRMARVNSLIEIEVPV
jgi:alpha-galactosidase